jgi:hypothetical protein
MSGLAKLADDWYELPQMVKERKNSGSIGILLSTIQILKMTAYDKYMYDNY